MIVVTEVLLLYSGRFRWPARFGHQRAFMTLKEAALSKKWYVFYCLFWKISAVHFQHWINILQVPQVSARFLSEGETQWHKEGQTSLSSMLHSATASLQLPVPLFARVEKKPGVWLVQTLQQGHGECVLQLPLSGQQIRASVLNTWGSETKVFWWWWLCFCLFLRTEN